MKIVKPSYEIITPLDGDKILKDIEIIGRTCYKSQDKITEESAYKFIGMLISRGHEAMIEHFNFSIKFICDRGISHEIVRHRLSSFAQESTRYCNYSKDKFGSELTFIKPVWLDIPVGEYKYDLTNGNILVRCDGYDEYEIFCNLYCSLKKDVDDDILIFITSMLNIEDSYLELIKYGWKPQQARSVLPNSLKTELIMTANLRQWRNFFILRTATDAHPQIRELATPLLNEIKSKIPIIFDDIEGVI